MQDLRRLPNGVHGGVFGGGAAAVFAGGMMAGAAASGVAVAAADRRLRPPPQQNLKCPRCDSINTKFCYYNNYNISQPRHFCKSCRRYWTKGGVLRNVPVGGSCRKSKRSSSSSSSSSSSRSPNLREEPKKTGQSPSPAAVPDPGRTCPVSVSYAAALMETTAEAAAPPPPVAAPLFPQMRSIKVSDFHDDVAAAANARNLHFQRPRFAPAADGNVKLPAAATPAGIMDPIMLMHPPPANPPTLPPPQLPALDWHVTMETPSWLFEDQGGLWNHNHWGEIDPSLFLP